MGYTTCFSGQFDLDKPLDDKTFQLLVGLSETRRVERAFRQEQGYGVDGEFYIEQGEDHGIILNHNKPPRTQPGLWCGWEPTEDRLHIQWNKVEKFYCYVEWLVYIVTKIIKPAGYKLSGTVDWQGEDDEDIGVITIKEDGTVQSQTVSMAPKWKDWTEQDVVSPIRDCFNCRYGGLSDPKCFFCSLVKKKHDAVDDYYYGKIDSFDPELWQELRRYHILEQGIFC